MHIGKEKKYLHQATPPRHLDFVAVLMRPRRRVDRPLSLLLVHLDQHDDEGVSSRGSFCTSMRRNYFFSFGYIEATPLYDILL